MQSTYVNDIASSWQKIRQNTVSDREGESSSINRYALDRPPPALAIGAHGKSLSQRSIQTNYAIVASFLKYLCAVGYLQFDPTSTVPSARLRPKQSERYLARAEWNLIYSALCNLPAENEKEIALKSRAVWLFSLGYLTGLRRSEILSATMAHIIKDQGDFVLKVWGKGRNQLDPNDYDLVYLPPDAVKALQHYRSTLGLPDHHGYGEDLPLVDSEYLKLSRDNDTMSLLTIVSAPSPLVDTGRIFLADAAFSTIMRSHLRPILTQ